MEGWRKLLATAVTLIMETGAFVLMVFVAKVSDAAVLNAYFIAVAATLAVYTGGNVVSKFSGQAEKPVTPQP